MRPGVLSQPDLNKSSHWCDSGRQIVEILRKNPDKEPEKYDEEDIAHMRKVVAVSATILCHDAERTAKAHRVQQTPSRARRKGQTGYQQQELQVIEELGARCAEDLNPVPVKNRCDLYDRMKRVNGCTACTYGAWSLVTHGDHLTVIAVRMRESADDADNYITTSYSVGDRSHCRWACSGLAFSRDHVS